MSPSVMILGKGDPEARTPLYGMRPTALAYIIRPLEDTEDSHMRTLFVKSTGFALRFHRFLTNRSFHTPLPTPEFQ